MNLMTASFREIGRGLMIGDKATFKQGYTAGNAICAIEDLRKVALSEEDKEYLIGFGDGMKQRRRDPSISATSDDYNIGFRIGAAQDQARINPA